MGRFSVIAVLGSGFLNGLTLLVPMSRPGDGLKFSSGETVALYSLITSLLSFLHVGVGVSDFCPEKNSIIYIT